MAIVPNIGASGVYELAAPLDTLILPGQNYTCKAIRKLSDYLSNNEDPKTDIYDKYGLVDPIYSDHVKLDIEIISLQSELGHWLYIPSTHILKYPDANGVLYRSVMIGVSLPSIPVDKDLSFLHTDISNLVADTIGVSSVIKTVETSRPTHVSNSQHIQLTADRAALSSRGTDRSRYLALLTTHQLALDKIAELEAYIEANYV